MIKVKEYLDKNFFTGYTQYNPDKPELEHTTILRKNGHYGVHGCWHYPDEDITFDYANKTQEEIEKQLPGWIRLTINNETIIVGNMHVKGLENKYHYLQTYEHIPRGEPDDNGYYRRSTDEEIIKYIDEYFQKLKENELNKS